MSEDRVQKLEELISFADQRSDGLDEAMQDIAERLQRLVQRLERVEHRLGALETIGDDTAEDTDPAVDDRPPHSGRLPGGR